jgi:hypothetical protein
MTTAPGNGRNPEDILKDLIKENQEKLAAFQQQGIIIDPLSLLHARIDALIESVAQAIGPQMGPGWAWQARMAYEENLQKQYAEVEGQASRIALSQGAGWTPAMIAQLARETGTFQVKRTDRWA